MTDEYRRESRLVRASLKRSQFQEKSEAIFLNSGYVYDSVDKATAFAGEADRFVYSRYVNPTVSMLQTRLVALATAAKLGFFESPSNPMLDLVDIPAVAEMAHVAVALVVIDNFFATPIAQKPLELGADIVIYSATKHIDGQSAFWVPPCWRMRNSSVNGC